MFDYTFLLPLDNKRSCCLLCFAVILAYVLKKQPMVCVLNKLNEYCCPVVASMGYVQIP